MVSDGAGLTVVAGLTLRTGVTSRATRTFGALRALGAGVSAGALRTFARAAGGSEHGAEQKEGEGGAASLEDVRRQAMHEQTIPPVKVACDRGRQSGVGPTPPALRPR